MPIQFVTRANANGALSGYRWSQDDWLQKKAQRRGGIGDQFGMDEGSCYMFSAEWLVMAKQGLADTFVLHMSLPDVHDTMQALKIAQRSGQADQVQDYLRIHGLGVVGSKDYGLPTAAELAQDVTAYSGFYLLGFTNLQPLMPQAAARSGHAIAAHISSPAALFDPNYGMAMFANSDDLCGFLIEVLSSGYGDLRGTTTVWKYS